MMNEDFKLIIRANVLKSLMRMELRKLSINLETVVNDIKSDPDDFDNLLKFQELKMSEKSLLDIYNDYINKIARFGV